MEKFNFRRIVSGVTALLTAALSVPYDAYADMPTDISAETHISETVVSDNGECIETKEFIFEDNAKHYYAMPVSGTKRAEKWIDRIPDIPEYALNYYHLLEESTNNDGVDDFLIDMSKAEISNGKHVLFSSPVTFTVKSQAEISSKLDEIADEAASWLSVVYSAFERDNPQVFWLKSYKQITVKTSTKVTADGYSVDLQMGYIIDSIFKDDYNTLDKLTEAIDNRDSLIESITSEIPKNISTQKKILAINEYLTTHNSYNSVVASGSSDVDEYVFTCLTALNGTTGKLGPVCEGYSKAFKVLCDSLNIPCIIEEGVADGEAQNYGGHMWNMVKLGSEWYGVDVTWNDPLSFLGDNNTAKSGREGTYFMFSGSETKDDGIAFNVSHISENAPGSQDFNFLNSPLMSKASAPFELVYGENDITKLSSYYDKADFGNGFLFVAPYESEFTFDEKTKVALKHGESYIYKPTDKTAETITVGENSPYTIKEYGICGNDASWRLTDDGLLLIDGDGEMFDYGTDNPPEWDEFADEITSVKISGISYIGSYAFRNCNELEEIELPDDIEIGSLACNENSPLNLHVMEDGFCVNCGEFTESPVIKDDICQISNVGQLYSYFSDFTDYDALLMNDITVNDSDGQSDIREWISAENYNSTFDGNGNTIYGLFADSSAVSVGFVSDIGEKGTVKNLVLDNVQFSGKTNVGAVCGKNLGRISECTVKGIGSADYVGGICAENKGTVELCTSSFTADTFKVCGGICAYNYGDCSYTLSLVPETVAVGISSNGTEKACYDLSEECSDAVKSGEAAYMLSQGGMKCGQLIGKDEYPDTENADISVYKVTLLFDDENTDTAILYTNDSADIITEYLDTLPMEYSYIPVNLPDEITEDTEIEIKVKETDFSILLTDLSQKAMSGVKLTVNEIAEDKEIHLYEDIFTEEEPVKISGLARNKNYRIYFEFENENITTEPMDIFIDKSGVLITDDEEKTDNLLIIECGLLPVSFACVNEEKTDSAEFRLDRFNGKVWETIAVINTSDELYPTQLLTTGKYSLRMTSAPYGCCLSDETVFSIDSEGNIIPDKSNTGLAEIKDGVVCVYAEKLVLKIKAVDSYGETVEMNAVITDSEGNVYKTEKDKDILVCRALNVPDLYTVEILSDGLDRYIIPEKLQLNIDSNGKTEGAETDEDGTILIKLYEKSTLSIEVISTEGNVIKGCEYAVIDNSGNEIAKLISATELSSIMLEPDSMYIIKETGVSEEYLFDEHSITIETDSKGNIITEGYGNGKIIITKMKKPVVNIEITDQYKKAVEGAEVVISAENGSIETYTSDSSIYTAENITKPGKYTITVHAVPSDICESYEEYSFKVDENGNVISECSEYNDGVFTIQLESYTEIEVNALNSESLKNISGALLSIQSANDISFTPYEFTSDSKTETVRLPSGKYYIECVKAPFGYFKPARVDFTVDKSGENQPIDIEFDEVSIRINYNAYGKSEFEINDNSGETVKEISVENGISEWIKGLGIGINYVIRQTLAPVMHDHNPDIEFSIEEDGKIEIDSGYNASAYDNEIYIDGDRYLWTTSQPTTTTTTTTTTSTTTTTTSTTTTTTVTTTMTTSQTTNTTTVTTTQTVTTTDVLRVLGVTPSELTMHIGDTESVKVRTNYDYIYGPFYIGDSFIRVRVYDESMKHIDGFDYVKDSVTVQDIISVDNKGNITALAPGSLILRVSSYGSDYSYLYITVLPDATTATTSATNTTTSATTTTETTSTSVTTEFIGPTTTKTATTTSTTTTTTSTTTETTTTSTTTETTTSTTTETTTTSTTTETTTTSTTTSSITTSAYGEVVINKIDVDGNAVSDAVLTLKGKDANSNEIMFSDGQIETGEGANVLSGIGNVIIWKTGSEKTIVKLQDGTYILHEMVSPYGYECAEDITFVIENGKLVDVETIDMVDNIISTMTTNTTTTNTNTTTTTETNTTKNYTTETTSSSTTMTTPVISGLTSLDTDITTTTTETTTETTTTSTTTETTTTSTTTETTTTSTTTETTTTSTTTETTTSTTTETTTTSTTTETTTTTTTETTTTSTTTETTTTSTTTETTNTSTTTETTTTSIDTTNTSTVTTSAESTSTNTTGSTTTSTTATSTTTTETETTATSTTTETTTTSTTTETTTTSTTTETTTTSTTTETTTSTTTETTTTSTTTETTTTSTTTETTTTSTTTETTTTSTTTETTTTSTTTETTTTSTTTETTTSTTTETTTTSTTTETTTTSTTTETTTTSTTTETTTTSTTTETTTTSTTTETTTTSTTTETTTTSTTTETTTTSTTTETTTTSTTTETTTTSTTTETTTTSTTIETATTSTTTETTTSTTTETTTTSTTTETTTTSTTTTTPPTTTTVEFGDINLDGVLDANDASVLLTYYALSSTGYSGTLEDYITEELVCDTNLFESALNIYGVFGDMNGDDIVDANDASLVLTYYAISSTGYTGTIKDYLSEIGI